MSRAFLYRVAVLLIACLVLCGCLRPDPVVVIAVRPDGVTCDPCSGYVPFTVQYDATGSFSASGIASYRWNFGDGVLSDTPTGEHT